MASAADIYYKMHLIRECEERIRREYSSDDIKTPVHLGIGAEAISVGVVSMMPAGTKYFGTYRNHALYLAVGGSLDEFWGELYGKETGCAKGKAGSMHLAAPENGLLITSAVVGTTIPLAIGAALSKRYSGDSSGGVVAFFGDGATEEGVFHESLNFAALHRLPITFVCEDNGLAIHNHRSTRQAYALKDLVRSYGIVYRACHGHQIDNIRHLLQPMLQDGPAFLHCTYHRFFEHVGPNCDFAAGYRERPVNEAALDPMEYLKTARCVAELDDNARLLIEERVFAEIDQAVARAKQAAFAGPEELMRDVYEQI